MLFDGARDGPEGGCGGRREEGERQMVGAGVLHGAGRPFGEGLGDEGGEGFGGAFGGRGGGGEEIGDHCLFFGEHGSQGVGDVGG